MVRTSFEVRRSTEAVEISLSGGLSAFEVTACDNELRAQLALVRPRGVRALVDLREVDGYTLEAREALVRLQRFLGEKATLTAYLGRSVHQRGLALWVSHMLRQQAIRCFEQRDDAERWLFDVATPDTGLRPLARASTPAEEIPEDEKAAG